MRPDVALDVRETSHTSAGMRTYVRELRAGLPAAAPELAFAEIGSGDNFDLAEQIGIPLTLARIRPRVVHFLTPYVPRFVPVPHIITVHDVIDLEFAQYAKPKVGPYWRNVIGPVLRAARAVITDDDVTVGLLEKYLRVDPSRVRVIPLGVDAPAASDAPDAAPAAKVHGARERRYAFYAGNHRPHKDLATLLRAWVSLPAGLPLDLIVTGEPDAELDATRGADGALIFAGERSAAGVWALHRGAAVYVQPALREGFGLPLLEAMRAGTPVIASDAAAPRVLSDFAALYPVGDAGALRASLERLLALPQADRDRLTERAQLATAYLTWQRTVARTADVYRDVLASA